MRAIGLLTLVLMVVSYLAFVWDTTPSESQENSTGSAVEQVRWVRTSDGWEKASTWMPLPPVYQPPLHPLVIAGLQGMLSLAALLAFPGRAKQEPATKACPNCGTCEA